MVGHPYWEPVTATVTEIDEILALPRFCHILDYLLHSSSPGLETAESLNLLSLLGSPSVRHQPILQASDAFSVQRDGIECQLEIYVQGGIYCVFIEYTT